MKAEDFDKKFDDNEDISAYLDVSKAHRPNQEQKRVSVDDPAIGQGGEAPGGHPGSPSSRHG